MKFNFRVALQTSALPFMVVGAMMLFLTSPSALKAQGEFLSFDGIDDILTAAPVTVSPPLTLECWTVWSCPNQGGTDQVIVYNGKTGTDGYGIVIYQMKEGEYHFGGYFGGQGFRSGPVAADTNTWHHVALVGTESNHWFLYVDGTGYDLDTVSTLPPTTSFLIGNSTDTTMPYYGSIDEMRLSGTERYTDCFTPPTEPFAVDELTSLLYAFDDGCTDTTADFSPFGNTGHLGEYPDHNPMWMLGGALPIQLAQFSASESAGGVTVAWSTFSEVNNYGFYVQRKLPGEKTYRTVSTLVRGAGTSLEKHNYTWTDAAIAPGTYLYRLQQVDLNGKSNHSGEIRIAVTGLLGVKDAKPLEFALHQNFPNPFNPSTSIRFSIPMEEWVSLKVYDMSGREVATLASGMRRAGDYTVRWNAGPMASGMYFYRLLAGSSVETRKMTVIQ